MNRLLLVLIAMCVVGFLFWRSGEHEQDTENSFTATKSRDFSKSVQEMPDEGGVDRFKGLRPELHALVEDLERDYSGGWIKARGAAAQEVVERTGEAWERYARGRISELSAMEIEALLHWMKTLFNRQYVGPAIFHYESALFWTWGQREPLEAIKFIDDFVAGLGPRSGGWPFSGHSYCDAMAGWAVKDGNAAWNYFQQRQASENSELHLSYSGAARGLLRGLASHDLEDAWSLIAAAEDGADFREMLTGFVEGVPQDEDWVEISQRIGEKLRELDCSPKNRFCKEIATRWFLEEPNVALGWYQDNVSLFEVYGHGSLSESDPLIEEMKEELFRRHETSELEVRGALQLLVFEELSSQYGNKGLVAVKDWLSRELEVGNESGELLVEGLIFQDKGEDFFASESESESDLASGALIFLDLIAALPSDAARRQFMLLIEVLPGSSRNNHSSSSVGLLVDEPKALVEVTRELMEKIPLTYEELAEAEAVFVRLAEEEG